MKKVLIAIVILPLLLHFCRTPNPVYEFQNSDTGIVGIQLVHNHNEDGFGSNTANFHIFCELQPEQYDSFIAQLQELSIETTGFRGPIWGFGEYFAIICYENGDTEYYGTGNIEYVASGEEPTGFGIFYFADSNALLDIFSQYGQISPDESDQKVTS